MTSISKAANKAQINVTPMVDVLLVLLIIFMVVVNQDSTGLEAKIPQPSEPTAASVTNPQDLILRIDKDGNILLNQEPVALQDLEPRLAQLFRMRGNHVLFLGADRNLDAEPVLHVIDVARGVGMDQVALLPDRLAP